ncbi:MAG: hypothetical protein Q7S33_02130 [Nanoarchaeota archaeon]|nr:hypothetical protein [Nanoarchaeota archaeon]
MYAWGGSTADWAGKSKYDFGSARARYDKIAATAASRTYTRRNEPDMALVDARGKTLTSESENPLIIAVDVTGSMAEWPAEIFDRLPLLYQTLGKYRPDLDIVFAAIGDATCDSYPLQVNDFAKDTGELEKKLKALGCEGGGGGHITESYELFGYFMQEHCNTPKAKSPFLLIYGDEAFYDKVDPRQVKHYIGDDLQSPLDTKEVWQNLMQKYNVYYMQKPYGGGYDSSTTQKVKELWGDALGKERIIQLPSMERAVDVAIGLIAKQWGEFSDFKLSMDARHDDPSLKDSVYKSLRHIDADPAPTSVMAKTGSVKTKSLLS